MSWNYYELFQMIVQAQADAIVKLGFKPVVKVFNNLIFTQGSLFYIGLYSNTVVSFFEALWCEEVGGNASCSERSFC